MKFIEIVRRVLSMLFSASKSGTPFDESTGQFLHVDPDEVKRELKLTKRAADNGAKGIPDLEDTKKDALATDIDMHMNYLISLGKAKLLEQNGAVKDLSKSQEQVSILDITEIYETATKDLTATAKNFYGKMFLTKNEWILMGKSLKEFREKNKLNRPAQYPDDRMRKFGFIFLIMVIEIIFNAYALGDAHPNGIVGVSTEILMFGIVNVGVSVILGFYVWRYFLHIQKLRQSIAILAFPMMAFVLFLNFFLAHYRDAISKLASIADFSDLQTSIQQLGGQAINTLIASPFVMDDIKSYLLLFVGLLASVIATLKSFELDDPYPGYGKQSRVQKRLADKFNYQNKNAEDEIIGLVEDYSQQMAAKRQLMKASASAITRREEYIRDLHNKYNIWLGHIALVGKSLYADYQDENRKARENRQKPKCFDLHDYVLPDDAKIELDFPKHKPLDIEAAEAVEEKYAADLNKQTSKQLF